MCSLGSAACALHDCLDPIFRWLISWVIVKSISSVYALHVIVCERKNVRKRKCILSDLSHLLSIQLHFWCRPSTAYEASLFSLLLQLFPALSFSKDWCALMTCPKYRIFSIFVMAFNEMFGLTFCKICFFFLSSTLLEFCAIPIVQNHQVFFFYPPSRWSNVSFHT